MINETDNVCTESSSNIDLISERIWPEINLTICDQDDTYRENEKKMKEMVTTITVYVKYLMKINFIINY